MSVVITSAPLMTFKRKTALRYKFLKSVGLGATIMEPSKGLMRSRPSCLPRLSNIGLRRGIWGGY